MDPPVDLLKRVEDETMEITNNLSTIVLVTICFHVPYNLMAKQLRNLGSFEYKASYIAYDNGKVDH